MTCEQCGIEHDGTYGSGRFCSDHCKRIFCGKQSNKDGKLIGRPGYRGPRKYTQSEGPFICRFCGDVRKSGNSLVNHERLCKLNPNMDIRSYNILRGNSIAYNESVHNGTRSAWNKGLTASTDDRVRKYAETSRTLYANGELMPTFAGLKHTEETKRKMHDSTMQYLEKTAGGPRYSIKACNYFDKLNAERGWHLVHAMNGGEIRVDRYSIDAYDKELNIVVEYDENKHHLEGVARPEKDIIREATIKKKLGCKFYRYSEFTGELYEV